MRTTCNTAHKKNERHIEYISVKPEALSSTQSRLILIHLSSLPYHMFPTTSIVFIPHSFILSNGGGRTATTGRRQDCNVSGGPKRGLQRGQPKGRRRQWRADHGSATAVAGRPRGHQIGRWLTSDSPDLTSVASVANGSMTRSNIAHLICIETYID